MRNIRNSANIALNVLAVVLVSIACQSCQNRPEHAEATVPPPKYNARAGSDFGRIVLDSESEALKDIKTEPVGNHYMEFSIQATGELQPNANAVTRVSAPTSGRIGTVNACVGEFVKRGQVIATLKSQEVGNLVTDLFKTETDIDAELSKDLLDIDCEVKQTAAELALHQKKYNRAKLLIDEKIGSQADLENVQTLVEKDQLSLRALQEKREKLNHVAEDRVRLASVAVAQKLSVLGMPEVTIRDVLDRRQLVSSIPITAAQAGFVLERNVNSGELVDSSRTLFIVDDFDTLWLVADIFEHDVQFVKRGENIEFKVESFPKETFKGKIDFVAGSMNPETRTLAVRALIPNPGMKLKPKMFARMKICAGAHRSLAIEKTAIQDAGSDKVVYVPVGPTEFIERKVVLGDENDKYVEILSGLKPGERVVTAGASDLRSQSLKQRG